MDRTSKQAEEAHQLLTWARQAPTDAEKMDRLLLLWRDEAQAVQWAFRPALLVGIAIGIAVFVCSWFAPATDADIGLTAGMAALMFTIMLSICAFAPRTRLTETQYQIRREIRNLSDAEAIGPLLDALDAVPGLRESIVSTLSRLMEQTPEAEVAAILSARRNRLYDLLDYTMAVDHPGLAVTIMRILPLMADRQALVCVTRYIWWSAPTQNQQHARAAACDVLPLLLARVDLGGPATLKEWVSRLPLLMQEMNQTAQWEAVLLPHLALMQILPQCTPETFLRLGEPDRHRLYSNLRTFILPRLKSDYALAVLDIVRRSADVEAMSVVRDLIDGPHATPYPRVRAAARECLPILCQQLEKEKVSKTLLRGASAPEAAPDILLRAASGTTAIDPQLLLRANVKESSGGPITDTAHAAFDVRPAAAGETKRDATLHLSGGQS